VSELHVLRVFCGDDARGGNPLGVFLDGHEIEPPERQRVAADLGFSETVFVDDASGGEIAIFTPGGELDFAGHPTVGTAWLLARERAPVSSLYPPAGEVPVSAEGELTFVAGRPEWGPPFTLVQLASATEVEALEGPPGDEDPVYAWAWLDEEAGQVRARAFLLELGIGEDEATGAAAVKLGAALGRALDIRQGECSRLLARPVGDGRVEVGGRVVLDEIRWPSGAKTAQ
jgi:predicted PhzF superfamily epimerase YddE/YHI9